MDYGMIGKIEKAKIYAEESSDRVRFETLRVTMKGDNGSTHEVSYDHGTWKCDCDFYATRGVCSHIMAMEKVLPNMVELGQVVA